MRMTWCRRRVITGGLQLLLAWVLLIPAGPVLAQSERAEGLTTIYLVRHAERADDHPSDPTLTPAGSERARELARVLGDVPLDAIHSTDYRRTRLTAAPVAEEKGMEVRLYDPRGPGMAELVEALRAAGGTHLVVGHSNTTPALVEALGGDPISPVEEDEYDRLYLVVLGPGGTVTSSLLRFGAEAGGGH